MATVNELIQGALYLSVLSLEFDTANQAYGATGLQLLNEILAEASIDASLITYNRLQQFTCEIGKSVYPIDGLIRLETLTFFLTGGSNNVRMEMIQDNTYHFYGMSKVTDIQSLPYHYYVQRRVGGSDIKLYFVPDQPYQMEMFGKFSFNKLSTDDLTLDLDTIYDPFYQTWLKYKLASRLCQIYGIPLSAEVSRELAILTNKITNLIGFNLELKTVPLTKRKNAQMNWAYINYGKGWTP